MSHSTFESAAQWAAQQFAGCDDCNPIPVIVNGERLHCCGRTSGEWITANGFSVVAVVGDITFAN